MYIPTMKSVIMNMLKLNLLLQLSDSPPGSSSPREINGTTSLTGQNVTCYEVYSREMCFSQGTSWANGAHPYGMLPADPSKINSKFLFYRFGAKQPKELNPEDLYEFQSEFDANKIVKIVSHGYKSSCDAYWAKILLPEITRKYGMVICLDWREGANMPYLQSGGNIRLVAFQMAFFINKLKELFNISGSTIHIIGHSLGAHMAGHAGTYLQDIYNNKISRITGLDPAGPSFSGSSPQARLDPSDAHFVDVIHTGNSPILGLPVSLGIEKYVGHIDFYPNGGKHQRGCNDLKCNHVRGCLLYIESIRPSACKFLAINCATYDDFIQGNCWGCKNGNCAILGEKSHPPSKNATHHNYFLLTHESRPYCGSHYRITIEVSNSSDSVLHGGEFGNIGIRINGFSESTENITLFGRGILLEPGKEYRRVVLAYDIGQIKSIDFVFNFGSSFMNPMSWRIQTPIMYLSSIVVEQLTPEQSLNHCFKHEKIYSNKNYYLQFNKCH